MKIRFFSHKEHSVMSEITGEMEPATISPRYVATDGSTTVEGQADIDLAYQYWLCEPDDQTMFDKIPENQDWLAERLGLDSQNDRYSRRSVVRRSYLNAKNTEEPLDREARIEEHMRRIDESGCVENPHIDHPVTDEDIECFSEFFARYGKY